MGLLLSKDDLPMSQDSTTGMETASQLATMTLPSQPVPILVAPTEPVKLKRLGQSSSVPEIYGADFLWRVRNGSNKGWAGIQRKEMSDLIASLHDGRLGKEVLQLRSIGWKGFVVEGGQWTNDGKLIDGGYGNRGGGGSNGGFTLEKLYGVLSSIQNEGIWCYQTEHIDDTYKLISMLAEWTNKESHGGLISRPSANSISSWGKANARDYGIYFLMGLPGVGYQLASRIYDHFGTVPVEWVTNEKELMEIEGVGKGKAKKILECFRE